MGVTILLIEGHDELRKVIGELLGHYDYQVMAVKTISEAHLHMESATPDLIMLDIQLPDGNGLDFCRELRKRGNKTPIMFLCGRTRDEHRKYITEAVNMYECYESGGNGYMGKPFGIKELDRAIKRLLPKQT